MLKERIYQMLNKHSLSDKLIFEIFSASQETIDALNELVAEGKIVQKKHEYYTPESLHLIKGRIVSIKENFSFANISIDEDVYIDNENLNSAFLDDEVWLMKDRQSLKDEYTVFSIIKRTRNKFVGEIKDYYGQLILDVKDVASKDVVFMINPTSLVLLDGFIAIGIPTKITRRTIYVDIIEVIGNKNDPGVDISSIIYKYGADIEFPEEVKKQVKNIPSFVSEEEKENREDFTDHLIVTIDGNDAKDFDDAVEVKRCIEGYQVGVHIADVAHYVPDDSPLDKEALSRGTSIYATDRVVPMLPFELSNGICSLNPHVDRLVTSCIFTVDPYGNILSSRITKGIINSHARLTYDYVNRLLSKDPCLEHLSSDIDQTIYLLNEVATKIRKRRKNQGSLDIESNEILFKCDEKGNPIDVIIREQGLGEQLIEDLMITANEQVAETIEAMELPFIYRIHEQPKSKKMDAFIKLSTHLGYKTNFSPLTVTPKELSNYLISIDNQDIKKIISIMLLRSLAKARYSESNKGHYGLASKSYTHFTSPIRRYPDLLVHRLIDRYLVNGNISYGPDFEKEIAFIAENTSIKERRAIAIEREVDDLESAKYMATKIGNIYSGFINGMVNKGMFVELDNGIDGLILFEEMDDDYYIFDENYMCAYGRMTNKVYSLGDKVEILVLKVNVKTHEITFKLINKSKTSRIKMSSKKKGVKKHGRKRKSYH